VFEWDEEKNQRNLEKHGIGFETAATIFRGTTFSRIDDRDHYDEVREISIGRIETDVVVVVVHTDRAGTISLISARGANRRKGRDYDDYCSKITR
jgi:uncharacterized DUF497 family protein